ncbi:MAG: hypothetical protein GWO08_15145, partial [Gammaproteobacteria bacterium]|nr:hypothetical protein [Gammaproteobacteria bacterium]NIR94945.1 hypothetical protein [Gammaproteobacteria bacterium]NIW49947.1 hypothetical protein [Gammaproteobacteria bacterium]NIX59396.1 hypothetical protein [candidate division Zixibacteria bacterium]
FVPADFGSVPVVAVPVAARFVPAAHFAEIDYPDSVDPDSGFAPDRFAAVVAPPAL